MNSGLPKGPFNLPPGVSLRDIDPPDDSVECECPTCGWQFSLPRGEAIVCPSCVADEERGEAKELGLESKPDQEGKEAKESCLDPKQDLPEKEDDWQNWEFIE